ncbi:MAG: hypothetical protein CSA07_01345 [Bacteroidia bacterium]|nr:MAG: hypothetical protein CSA07_01345 [Bacteroidia bacterium]
MMRKQLVLLPTLILALLVATTPAWAQSMKEAVELYNQASKGLKQQPQKAIDQLQRCVTMARGLKTAEAKELEERAQKLLPKAYHNHAKLLYEKERYSEAIAQLNVGRARTKDKKSIKTFDGIVLRIYFEWAKKLMKEKKYGEAHAKLDSTLAVNPKYMPVYILKAKCYEEQNDEARMLATLEQGIAKAKEFSSVSREQEMRTMYTNHLKKKAFAIEEQGKLDEAIALFGQIIRMDERDAVAYLKLSEIHHKKKDYDQAIANAEKALQYAQPQDKTQIYYLQAQALQAKGDKPAACEAYRKAANGQFKEAAEYQLKELKCAK